MIDVLPEAPSISDPQSVFNSKSLALVAALSTFVTQANQLEAATSTSVTAGTSVSSLALGTGAKVFVTQAGKLWGVGMPIAAVDVLNPANFMIGVVTAYAGTNLTTNMTSSAGAGTKASWAICLAGAPGAQGPAGSLSAGGNMTAALNFARATVASAATTADIWTGGNEVNFTGVAAVTGFPNAPQAGASRTLHCAGACTFTAGANMLVDGLATGEVVAMAANDIALVHALTTTQFRVQVRRYNGQPASRRITSFREDRVTLAANNLDCSLGNVFTRSVGGSQTFTVSNVPAAGQSYTLTLNLTVTSTLTATWWAGVTWPGGLAPSLPVGRHRLVFTTEDGGTVWDGFAPGKSMS